MKNQLMTAACVLSLTSCASILEPYKSGIDSGLYATSNYKCDTKTTPLVGSAALKCVLRNSTKLQTAYLTAVGEHELVRTLTGMTVIGTSAYLLAILSSEKLGPSIAGNQAVALGAASAALMGTTTLFTSPRRQDVYIAGAKAVACVQLASAPFIIEDTEYTALQNLLTTSLPNAHITSLPTGIQNLETAIANYQVAFANETDDALLLLAQDKLAKASQAHTRGQALKRNIDRAAPARARNALRGIDLAVSQQLRQTQPDLSAIMAVQGQLGSVAAQLAPGYSFNSTTGLIGVPESDDDGMPEGATPEEEKAALKAAEANKQTIKQQLGEAINKIGTGILLVNSLADAVESEIQDVGQISACGYAPVNLELRINPETLTFKAEEKATRAFAIEEGEAPFHVEILGDSTGLTIANTRPMERIWAISSDGKTTKDNYVAMVMDKTGKAKPINITVEPKPEKPAIKDDTVDDDKDEDEKPISEYSASQLKGTEADFILKIKHVKKLQLSVCQKNDGGFGPDTRLGIQKYQIDVGRDKQESLLQNDFEYLVGEPTACYTTAPKSWFEQRMIDKKIMTEFLNALGLDPEISDPELALKNTDIRAKITSAHVSAGRIDDSDYKDVITSKLCAELLTPEKCKSILPKD